ncbi:hypothetical protein ACRAWB_16490 [Leifsonia poae]|uniref:arsenate reductase/protein-tyrosine-phosphatase family protein n=1 Tax=Leifsonia poae TaxID=110933 RepID=UPI003D691B9E
MPVILLVCTANICRSPLAAGLLDAALRPQHDSSLQVLSAGTTAVEGAPICPTSMHQLRARHGEPLVADASRRGRLTVDLLDEADLVLTADRHQRSFIAQLSPAARSRTFTLREAAYLASAWPAPAAEAAELTDLVQALNGLRGRVPLPGSGRRGLLTSRRTGIDIHDGHAASPRHHAETLQEVSAATEALAAFLRKAAAVA